MPRIHFLKLPHLFLLQFLSLLIHEIFSIKALHPGHGETRVLVGDPGREILFLRVRVIEVKLTSVTGLLVLLTILNKTLYENKTISITL